jgi:hypothetical protein
MKERIKKIIGSKHSLFVLSMFIAIISVMLCSVFYSNMTSAYNRGQIDKYMETQEVFSKIQKILDEHSDPEKSGDTYPAQINSAGEIHPAILDGNNLKQFVFNNCSEEVRNIYKGIISYSESQGIKPELVFAITWSDTQCGQNLTTPNNYGNVNNNDRGNRVGYFSPLEGFKAIVDTLNNQYLSGVVRIGDLSQGGRTGTGLFEGTGAKYSCAEAPMPYKCYATSVENWHNNLMRSLKVMGVENVDSLWEFRI